MNKKQEFQQVLDQAVPALYQWLASQDLDGLVAIGVMGQALSILIAAYCVEHKQDPKPFTNSFLDTFTLATFLNYEAQSLRKTHAPKP